MRQQDDAVPHCQASAERLTFRKGRAARPCVGPLFGFCFTLAFPVTLMAQTAPGVLQLGEFTNYLYYGFCIAALAAAAFRSRRGLTLKDNTHFLAAATVACVTGSVAVLASASCANSYVATVLFLLGTPLASVGISIAMLAWYEL